MENHPIPQDVTGFKFKLIGSVTVKQFLYLLGFGILATIVFVMPLSMFVKYPLMLLFAGIGASLAFVPIEGRPMDVMIMNFAKVIPSENRYIYRKRGANLASYEFLKFTVQKAQTPAQAAQAESHMSPQDEKRKILLGRLRNTSYRADENELSILKNIKSVFEEGANNVQKLPDNPKIAIVTPHVIEEQKIKPVDVVTQESAEPEVKSTPLDAKTIEHELEEAKKMIATEPEKKVDLEEKIKELEGLLQQATADKDSLSKKVVEYESANTKKDENVFSPTKGEEQQETQSVKFVPPSATLNAGFPSIPDVPNIVMGIVKDPRGKTLPNVLVEVVDGNGLPVRAFKTNSLGQFASATPLQNGTYKMYFDDPTKQHEFEIIEIKIGGDIFQPIEVTSVDSREKLRRELFGTTAGAQIT